MFPDIIFGCPFPVLRQKSLSPRQLRKDQNLIIQSLLDERPMCLNYFVSFVVFSVVTESTSIFFIIFTNFIYFTWDYKFSTGDISQLSREAFFNNPSINPSICLLFLIDAVLFKHSVNLSHSKKRYIDNVEQIQWNEKVLYYINIACIIKGCYNASQCKAE